MAHCTCPRSASLVCADLDCSLFELISIVVRRRVHAIRWHLVAAILASHRHLSGTSAHSLNVGAPSRSNETCQMAWMMVTILFLVGALRTNVSVVSTLFFTVMAFLFLGVAQFTVKCFPVYSREHAEAACCREVMGAELPAALSEWLHRSLRGGQRWPISGTRQRPTRLFDCRRCRLLDSLPAIRGKRLLLLREIAHRDVVPSNNLDVIVQF